MKYFLIKTNFIIQDEDEEQIIESLCFYDDEEIFETEKNFLKDYFKEQTELFLPVSKGKEIVFFNFKELWENFEVLELSKEQLSIMIELIGNDEFGQLSMLSIVEIAIQQNITEQAIRDSFLDEEIKKLLNDVNNKMN